jgi:hypothetical protein
MLRTGDDATGMKSKKSGFSAADGRGFPRMIFGW